MKRMIDCDKIHVNNQGKVEIKDAKFTNAIELPATQSAKKIYCHPLECFISGVGIFCALIFNNSADVIDSWAKLKSTIASFGGTNYNRLLITGAYNHSSKVCICSEIVHFVNTGKYYINGVDTDGTIVTGNVIDLTDVAFTSIVDDVNAIN